MNVSQNNHSARTALYYGDRRIIHSLEVWLSCVAEEFLIQNFPDKTANWVAHQMEYVNWGPYSSRGTVEFRWLNGGSGPLFPASSDDLKTAHLLHLYEYTRDIWVTQHVGAVAMAIGHLERVRVPAYRTRLPSALNWLCDHVAPRESATSPYHLLGVEVYFSDNGKYRVLSSEKYGSIERGIEFPKFTNLTFGFMPDVSPDAVRQLKRI